MTVPPNIMRDTLRFWASGVSIVATSDGEVRAGMTVSSFSSLCIDPALVLVCIYKDTHVANMIESSGSFAVSILSEEQVYLSDRFAGRVPLLDGEDRFDGVVVAEGITGSPLIVGALAWIDCRVQAIHDGVTHWIIVGEVMATGHQDDDGAPLIYYNRDYRAMQLETERT
jgi:3-hydroxy-9,10-secoandrosta-1,3,5(10)-triene-9,17-dione monooxygenase reductase component